ncbi:ferredoxin [Streptomyces sp. NPDC046465]|uniref:ferredoxin n=1 Tax=Streptomyces sp. NPDC046465 TaxID=3155810 RepID=UPI0033E44B89
MSGPSARRAAEDPAGRTPESGWSVHVDRGVCGGSAICVGIAPGRFRIEDRKSRPVEERIEPDERVRDAADSCPWEALTVTDLATGAVLAPEQ